MEDAAQLQRAVLDQAGAEAAVGVEVAVDQAGDDQEAGAVDHPRGALQPVGLEPVVRDDGLDAVVADDDAPPLEAPGAVAATCDQAVSDDDLGHRRHGLGAATA